MAIEKQLQENLELLTKWCLQYTDEMVNENVAPIVNELISDKAFITLLKQWDKEHENYIKYRSFSIEEYFEGKILLSEVTKKLPLRSYHNSVYDYNDALLTIVHNWNKKD